MKSFRFVKIKIKQLFTLYIGKYKSLVHIINNHYILDI